MRRIDKNLIAGAVVSSALVAGSASAFWNDWGGGPWGGGGPWYGGGYPYYGGYGYPYGGWGGYRGWGGGYPYYGGWGGGYPGYGWGGYPGYLSLIHKDFNRAGEDAWLIGLSYDFSRLGLPGLSAFTNFASGNTPDSGSRASYDQKEFDLTVDYRFSDALEGLWIRARTAHVDQDGDGEDSQDYRLIVNYSVPLK